MAARPSQDGASAGSRGRVSARGDRRAARDWLALRAVADTTARDGGAGRLPQQLAERCWATGGRRLVLVDLGAGTGANQRYLGPRLPVRQRWVAVDRDPDHLRPEDHPGAELVVAEVADLGSLLAEIPLEEDDRLVLTCSALLDVLTDDELAVLADAVVRHDAAALLSLSVTGEVGWSPPHRDDELLRAAFDEHQRQPDRGAGQRRHTRPGPDAPAHLAQLLRDRGREVSEARTDWVLGAVDAELVSRFLDERVEAAVEQRPQHAAALRAWQDLRRQQLRSGELEVVVGHVDLHAPLG